MNFCIHRVNSISELATIPIQYGVEIDCRAYGNNIVLNHEPFENGDLFEDFLKSFNKKYLICNIKESGIEDEVVRLLHQMDINNYFLLDVETPYLFSKKREQRSKIALRLSYYENVAPSLLKDIKNQWFWIDTVNYFVFDSFTLEILKNNRSCLCCPDRWGQKHHIAKYKDQFNKLKWTPEFIMCEQKNIMEWSELCSKNFQSI